MTERVATGALQAWIKEQASCVSCIKQTHVINRQSYVIALVNTLVA